MIGDIPGVPATAAVSVKVDRLEFNRADRLLSARSVVVRFAVSYIRFKQLLHTVLEEVE